jgi:hypothetical protein
MVLLQAKTWIASMLDGLALLTMADPRPKDDRGPLF